MLDIFSFLKLAEKQKIEACFRFPELSKIYWSFEEQYSITLNFVLNNIEEKKDYYLGIWTSNFFDVFITHNLRKPSDLVVASKNMDKNNQKKMMNLIMQNYLTHKHILIGLYRNEPILSKFEPDNWFEITGRLYIENILNSNQNLLSIEDIFPINYYNYPNSFQEYILSWIFEENRLTAEGEDYFCAHFPKKYAQIKKIKSRRLKN